MKKAAAESIQRKAFKPDEERLIDTYYNQQIDLFNSSKKDMVNSPPHYNQAGIECIDALRAATDEGYQYYLQGNIIKYLWRYRYKNGVEDLKKAHWYLKKMIKVKSKIVRAIPLPPISLRKGPVPIYPPNKKVKIFFDKIVQTIEIKNEKLSKNFWAISGTMASFYELLTVLSNWLIRKKTNKLDAQKYVTLLYSALADLAVINSSKPLKNLVNEQTPGGLNWQGVNQLRKKGFYKKIDLILNNIYKRLNKK